MPNLLNRHNQKMLHLQPEIFPKNFNCRKSKDFPMNGA